MQTAQQFGEVEPYQQIEKYSCGAATLKAVLQHYGTVVDERPLITLVGVDPKTGSSAHQVANAAHRLGFDAEPVSFDSIDELATYTAQDIPVIVAIQSFTRPDQGHFVVATRVRGDRIDIMDPNVRGNRRTLTRAELDRRWKFRERTGVVIVPRSDLGRPRARHHAGKLGDDTASSTKSYWIPILIGLGAVAAVTTTVLIVRRRAA